MPIIPAPTRSRRTILAILVSLAVLAQSVILALASPASAAATIELSSASGLPGASTTATGSGFPKKVNAEIYFGSWKVSSFRTSARGAFSKTVTVPTGLSGTVTVTAKAGVTSASTTFDVLTATAVTASPTPTSTATPTETATPTTSTATTSTAAFGPGSGRPWAPDTAYNVPISAGAVTDPNSAAMVAVIARNNRAYANLYEYADPVFDADSSSPQYSVNCTEPWGTCDLETKLVRIPADAQPTPGTDGRMIVIDWSLREVCDFWRARRTSTGGWETSWGTCASIDGNGTGPSGGATGAGINALAGVVRTYEIRQGVINHALSFGTDNSCQKVFRHPATKTDGASARTDCIPEGARIQLDPSINVDALPGITPGEKAVAKALQTYGAYNRDNAGAPMAFAFESPIGESDPYPGVGFAWDYYDMPHIPWSKIRVLRSWNDS